MDMFSDLFFRLREGLSNLFSFRSRAPEKKAAFSETRLYVGNLSYSAREEDLRKLFSKYGQIRSVKIIRDRFTRKLKGYAFVEMGSGEAEKAIELNGTEFLSRKLVVSKAKARPTVFRHHNHGRHHNRQGGGRGGNTTGFRPFYAKGCEKPIDRHS